MGIPERIRRLRQVPAHDCRGGTRPGMLGRITSVEEACHALSTLWAVPHTQEQIKKTSLGYRIFRCARCGRHSNERSGTPFNDLSVPTDIVFLRPAEPGGCTQMPKGCVTPCMRGPLQACSYLSRRVPLLARAVNLFECERSPRKRPTVRAQLFLDERSVRRSCLLRKHVRSLQTPIIFFQPTQHAILLYRLCFGADARPHAETGLSRNTTFARSRYRSAVIVSGCRNDRSNPLGANPKAARP